ncbi:winged helix-turn-helix domain-containing protein [Phenylobacterium sp.]|uniref:winged helix-turn-helix domain-containing protein n=1 Tax=Phenylobacterium sp. TaxID=1871053 RepID=UPI00286CEAA0|nr:winged helix-turn-helix domain-containing protein [Phenylobacterium sp.]
MTDRFLVAGPYRLDLEDERVWRAETSLHLGGKAFALLRALMERPQVLVTKDELFQRAWPGLAVSDSVLTTAIKELRRALGDDARSPEVIGTVHGRGYRFLMPVERRGAGELVPAAVAGEAAPRDRTRPAGWLVALALAMASLIGAVVLIAWRQDLAVKSSANAEATALKSVVVLPFADLTPGRSETWFADGMTEEISFSLARAPDLRVISRQAAARFRDNDTDVRAVARELDVAHVLTGSVRRDGDHVRVSAQLIRAADGAQLWSQTYDRHDRGVIAIQQDIAFHIASSLKSILEPARLRAMVDAGTRSVEAYEAYLRGVALDQRQSDEGDVGYARAAAVEYERARALDPNFAAAHWRAANSWFGNATRVVAIGRGQSDEVERANYVARLDAAIAASTNEAESLKYRAARASAQLQIKDAHRLMVRYLEARPRDIDAWEEMADLSAYAGERRWMARAAERLQTLSMEDGYPRSRAITVSVMALQYDAAVQRSRRQLKARPDNALTQYQAHRAFVWAGRLAEARRLLEQVKASAMPADTKMLAEIRQACAEGRVEDARILRRGVDAVGRETTRWQAAMLLGDAEGGYRILLPLDTAGKLPTLMQFMIYPDFDPSRYPNLNARLIHEGVARRPVTSLPFACKTA